MATATQKLLEGIRLNSTFLSHIKEGDTWAKLNAKKRPRSRAEATAQYLRLQAQSRRTSPRT